MKRLLLLIVVFGLFSVASPLPNCDLEWNGDTASCSNAYGVVSQFPAHSNDFRNVVGINITSVNSGSYTIAFGFSDSARPVKLEYYANVTEWEYTYGWVQHNKFLDNVIGFTNITSSSSVACDYGQMNARNDKKYNISWLPNGSVSSAVFCFKSILNQTPDYTIYWDLWEVNGVQPVVVPKWVEVTGWKTIDHYGLRWYYLENLPFNAGVVKKGRLTYDVKPNSAGKYDILLFPSSKGLSESITDGTYFYLDPWYYSAYSYQIEYVINNTASIGKINELVVLNLTDYSGLCESAGCFDVRAMVENASGSWLVQPVVNYSQNYTTETDLQGRVITLPTQIPYWIAPAKSSPLYAALTVNVSASNTTRVRLYIGSNGVTDWGTTAFLYGTSFCDASAYGGNWTNNVGGVFSACSFTSTTTNVNVENSIYVGQAGGFWTANTNTTGNDPVWMAISLANDSSFFQYEAHTSVATNNDVFRVGGGFTSLDDGNATTPVNATVGLAFYPNGTRPIIAFSNQTYGSETSLLTTPVSQANNDTPQVGNYFGYNLYGIGSNTIRNLCYLWYGADGNTGSPTEYCRTFFDFGGSAPSFSGLSLGSLVLFNPENTTLLSPVNVTYFAQNDTNATFDCNVTIDGLGIYNETHLNATNTSFLWALTAGFHNISVGCGGTAVTRYFTVTASGLSTTCNATSAAALNFTFATEENNTSINMSMDASFWLWDATRSNYSVHNFSWVAVPNATLCISPVTAQLLVDSFQIYYASGYNQRAYFLWNSSVNATVQQVRLYGANDSFTKNTLVTLLDANGVPVESAFVQAWRYYPALNEYKIVAMLKTDVSGQSVSYLTPNTVWFRFIALENATVLGLFNPQLVTCDTGLTQCILNLRLGSGVLGDYWEYNDKVAHSCWTTGNITTCSYADTSGLSATYDLKVWKAGVIRSTLACEVNSTAAGGLLVCDVTGSGSGEYNIVFTRVGSMGLLEAYSFIIGSISTLFGTAGVFIAILIFCVAVGAFLSSPSSAIMAGVLSLLGSFALGLLAVEATYIFALVVVGLVIAWKMRH